MNPPVIQFACSHCQTSLTVPAHLAGVAGPCPTCGQHIVSPAYQPEPPAQAAPPPAAPAWNSPEMHKPSTGGMWTSVPAAATAVPAVPDFAPPVMPMIAAGIPEAMPQGSGGFGDAGSGHSFHSLMQAPPMGMQGQPSAQPQTDWAPPSAAPMQQGSWGNSPAVPLQGAGALPSVAMQPTLLRPGTYASEVDQGPRMAPPQAPGSPVMDAMRGVPAPQQQAPAAQAPHSPSTPLSRPLTIGGSRLSLLARQLTTPEPGTQALPMAPPPLDPSELPGARGMPAAAPMPNSDRYQQANDIAMRNVVRRGIATHGGRQSGWWKLVALFIVLGVLAGGWWAYRNGMADNLIAALRDPKAPIIQDPGAAAPMPGVDAAPAQPVASAPAPAATPKPLRAEPLPVPETVKPAVSQTPPAVVEVSAPAPRAVPVDEPPATSTLPPKASTSSVADTAPTPSSSDLPVLDRGASSETAISRATNTSPGNLVEISRPREEVKTAPAPGGAPLSDSSAHPLIKNVPASCNKALEGLKRFLSAATWKERLDYTQMPAQMQRKMQVYYASNPDGPVDVDEIHFLRHDESPEVGKGAHTIFILFSRQWDYGFPVMVEESGGDARVDWLAFVEFKDDLLHKFLTSYMEGPIRFHLGIRRTHYFEDDVPNRDEKSVFDVTTPMENVRGYVFVPKGSPLDRSLAGTISWDKELSWVIAELQWRREGTRKWVELTALPQLNWYGADSTDIPDTAAAPSSPIAKP